ncbi:MAG TPA: histone deacetylase [Cyclobacteriaceae bacterium]|jgi:acetoin utilization deacetylase AcuC-like enzyme|nr:histone deacetylase [Cyclobacteriaceae bacterium]
MLKVAWSSEYVLPLPPGHRFPMSKYEMLPQQLLYEGTLHEKNFFTPDPVDEGWILKTHEADYWKKLKDLSLSPPEIRRVGFPLTPELVQREITIVHGTMLCAEYALQNGIAMNIAGGTHHAFTNKGEGFCLLNDIAMAANYLLAKNLVKQILVVDLDVHQGNGTAQIFKDDPRVFTFSMHGTNNYPLVKETSNLDIGLPDFTTDDFYLSTLDVNLKNLVDQVQPDFIFFQSGVDILETDKMGRLKVTKSGCKTRDRLVFETAKKNTIPIVASMGGGYSEFLEVIDAHANTYRVAQETFS